MGDPLDQPPSDLVDVVPQIVDTLRSGRAVCLSDGRRSAVIADGTREFQGAWDEHQNGSRGVLLLRDLAAARDFVADPSPAASRLMKKCWPGDVRLVLSQGVDTTLIGRLPRAVRETVEDERGLSLCVPNSIVLRYVLHRVEFPLVKVDLAADGTKTRLTVFPSDAESLNTDAEIRVNGDRWELLNTAGLTPAEVAHMMTECILFVCTGNTCRSPMAAGMFRHMLAARLNCRESELVEKGFDVSSAGLSASPGLPASPESVEVCRACGVDLTGHSSQPLTESLLLESDRIYTMTAGHREAIVSRYPELEDDVRLLSPAGEDVSDPIGWGTAAYEQCHREIVESLENLVEELVARP